MKTNKFVVVDLELQKLCCSFIFLEFRVEIIRLETRYLNYLMKAKRWDDS